MASHRPDFFSAAARLLVVEPVEPVVEPVELPAVSLVVEPVELLAAAAAKIASVPPCTIHVHKSIISRAA
jgi:hypothetical protein